MPLKQIPDWQVMIERAAKNQHVFVAEFVVDDVIIVETKNSRYFFKIVDPEHRRVVMTSSNPECPGPIEGCLQGSLISSWGSSICAGRISLNQGISFTSAALMERGVLEIRTSPVRAVYYRGAQLLPQNQAGTVQ